MESSEDDKGAARDAVGQPSTRENTEMLSGGREVHSVLTSAGSSGENLGIMERAARSSPVLDEDGCHNTETILNMIDEFIDEPKPAKSAKYSADSTVCGPSPPREVPSHSGKQCNDRLAENCSISDPAQAGSGSPQSRTPNRGHVKDKQLEDMVNDISSSSNTSQGALGSNVVDGNTICDPVESCSKIENLPGQRKKLMRSVLSRDNVKLNSIHSEEDAIDEVKHDAGGNNNDTSSQLSIKKVKLVRHSVAKAKPLTITKLPLQVHSSSGISAIHLETGDGADDRLSSTELSSSICDANKSLVVHSSIEQSTSASKIDTSDVKLLNSVDSVSKSDTSVIVDESNDVLDVRKVTPLILNLNAIDESLNNNHDLVEGGNECKSTSKKAIKTKHNVDDSKVMNKVSRLNIKPVKPPCTTRDGEVGEEALPTCSKTKHSDESEHSATNIMKLNIKLGNKPVESSEYSKESKSSSGSNSECESSENEVTMDSLQSPVVETSEHEERSVPKLTIKSISTVPKVDCEPHKHKSLRRSQSPEPPVVHKLHIKPLVPPPIEKMTIKLNKTHENESICELDSSYVESVPKMTIKLGKIQEDILENNYEDEKVDCPIKMKIRLGKSIENSVDSNSEASSEICPVTRSSKRHNQKHEHSLEQHVPKLTIKIPQDHEIKSTEKSSNSPSIPKLTIKPIVKPEEVERSCSPTIPKLTIKPIPKPEGHEYRDDEKMDHPSIPKLTIKPIPKPDELESKLSETTDCHGVPKLTIKTVKADDNDRTASPVPKLTIKPILKPSETETDSQVIPKLTIKPVIKPDEQIVESEAHSIPKLTIKPIVKPNDSLTECDLQTVPKLTIKPIIKPGDVVEVNDTEMLCVPKITIKPVVKYDENDLKHSQGPSSPSIPKLTIKSVTRHDSPKVESDVCDSSLVPKLTIKNIHKSEEQQETRSIDKCVPPKIIIKPVAKPAINELGEPLEVSTVHKLTIKPILKPEELVQESSNINKSISKSVMNDEEEGIVSKISIKPIPRDGETIQQIERPEEVSVRTRSKVSLEETISKLNSKNKVISEPSNVELTNDSQLPHRSINRIKPGDVETNSTLPESLTEPLEVITSPSKNSPSHTESGSDSPRIILKINKCSQGSVSEVLIDDEVQNKESEIARIQVVNDSDSSKSDGVLMTVKDDEISVDVANKNITDVKDVNDLNANDMGENLKGTSEISKENDESFLKVSNKRLRNRDSSNKGTIQSKRQKLDSAISNLLNKNKKNPSLTVATDEENVASLNKSTALHNSTDCSLPNNGENNFNSVNSDTNSLDVDNENTTSFEKVDKNNALVEGDSNTTLKSLEDIVSDANQHGSYSPTLPHLLNRNVLVMNEETNSQECMMIDELSQDPLDIESAAKSHFAPVTTSTIPVMSIKDTIKIVEQTPQDIAISLGLTPQPKKRGRPRKHPLPEGFVQTPKPPKELKISPKLPTPALEERPVRVLRTPRDRPAILRTPKSRGNRGRGGLRRGAANSGTRDAATSPPVSPSDQPIKFFELKMEDRECGTTPCKVTIPRLPTEESADEDEDYFKTLRGGRGGRIIKRGGRGSRGGRGKGSRGGLLKGGQRGEEIQLQDALPLPAPRREGRKSKLEPTLTPALEVFEEETCMIGDNATPKRNIDLVDDESQNSVLSSQTVSESGTRSKRPKLMDMLDEGHKEWTPADIAEYDWPVVPLPGDVLQTYMIQEQIALYLGVKSFKRRYPDVKRRPLSAEEKNYLRDKGLLSEAMCDLGVTAVDAAEMLDIMYIDYPDKYEEYRVHRREKREVKPAPTPAVRPALAPPSSKPSVSKQEILEKACESAAAWNSQFNRQRKTERMTSMDLQTLTVHKPLKPPVVQQTNPKTISYYPVALLPGQFTDYYRDYTPEELRYFPLNTVMELLPSPKPVVESSSEDSDSNSDSEHSSGAESDSETSTVETNSRRKTSLGKAKARQSVANSRPVSPSIDATPVKSGSVKSEVASSSTAADIPNKCKICEGSEFCNKRNPNEAFITCATCHKKIHPSCLDMSPIVTKCVRNYDWQCADCKCCGQCGDLADDDKMLFCDLCDRGYHIYCVGLKKVPTGRWHCSHCAACRSCASRTPSGPPGMEPPAPGAPPDQWHHHFKRTNSGQRVYSHTLCAPCAKAWRSGRFCPSCEKCFVGRKGAMGLVICIRCDMRYHQECVRQVRKQLDVQNFTCSSCRRGTIPKHKLRRGERTPRKALQMSADSSMHSIITDSNSSMQNTSSIIDQGGDSSSAIDSMQPSPMQDRNNDSNSVTDMPLINLKARQSDDRDDEYGDDSKNDQSQQIDFKTASRRLFSVEEISNGSNIPSNTSETINVPNTATGGQDEAAKGESKEMSNIIPGDGNDGVEEGQEARQNVEGGA